jgi:L-histidine N-alpha-methyltransferase
LYDEIGSQMYERITEQPEYYLTRVEDRILADNAAEIRRIAGPTTIVELGSGSSTKTRHILEAWMAEGAVRYVPIDISRSAIEHACTELAALYPGLAVEGLAARYGRALPLISSVSPLLLVFLGSTIGNFNDAELDEFLGVVAASLGCGDKCLLGIDLVKQTAALDAAYNDAAGWTERFVINILARMNRELGNEIPLGEVEYDGFYNEELERVEMYLRFTTAVQVRVPGVAVPFSIAAGESVMIEISRKFRVEQMVAKMREFGFALERQFTDSDEFFAVLLLTRQD